MIALIIMWAKEYHPWTILQKLNLGSIPKVHIYAYVAQVGRAPDIYIWRSDVRIIPAAIMIERNDVMKTILNVTKDNDTISVHVDEDVTTEELEYGLINVMYHLIIRDMKNQGIRFCRNNFNQMNQKYGEAVKVQIGVMWDLMHKIK